MTEPAAQLAELDKAQEIGKRYMGGEPYTLGGALNGMAACVHDMQRSFIVMGRYAMAIKEMTGHGEFEKIIKEKFEDPGILSLRLVQNSMKIAKFAMEKGVHLDYFRELPKMKQLMLAGADGDDIGDDGTVFGLSGEEIKSTKIKDLRKIIDSQKNSLLEKDEVIEKGREQLADLKEKNRTLKDRTKILGPDEVHTRNQLQKDRDLLMGVLDTELEQINISKMSPAQIAEVKTHTDGMLALVETWADQIVQKIQQSK